jgi:hypothetical protein
MTMKKPQVLGLLVLAATSLMAASMVCAQSTFKCSGPGGTHYSDRPCPADAKTTVTTPVLPKPTPKNLVFDTRAAFLSYLSSECRQLHETARALQAARPRTSSEWALYQHQLSDAAERYRSTCMEEEQFAYNRVAEADRLQRQKQRSALEAREADEQRMSTEKQQCLEMRSIRKSKRERLASMSAGEKSDFERFESAFTTRCDGVVTK